MKFWSNADTPGDNNQVPERRLLAAVLQRAITDYLTGEGDLKESARAWLMDGEPVDAPLSFQFICEALDLDYLSLKEAIRQQGEGAEEEASKAAVSSRTAGASRNSPRANAATTSYAVAS